MDCRILTRQKRGTEILLHSKFSRDNSGKKSAQVRGCICDTNSLVMASESFKNSRMCVGELNPFWNSERKRHHSRPFLCFKI